MKNLCTLKALKSHIKTLNIKKIGQMLSVLIWDFSVLKVYKLCIGWNNKIGIESKCTVEQWINLILVL